MRIECEDRTVKCEKKVKEPPNMRETITCDVKTV